MPDRQTKRQICEESIPEGNLEEPVLSTGSIHCVADKSIPIPPPRHHIRRQLCTPKNRAARGRQLPPLAAAGNRSTLAPPSGRQKDSRRTDSGGRLTGPIRRRDETEGGLLPNKFQEMSRDWVT